MPETASTLWAASARQRFEQRGLVRIEGVVPRHTVETMAGRLWRDLADRHGAQPGKPATWTVERPSGFQAVQASGAFDTMATPSVRALLDELMHPAGWLEPPHWGQPLACFPTSEPWALPHRHWHVDGPCEPTARRRMVGRLFLILAPVAPQGGGTLVATGSHRLVEALADEAGESVRSGEMRQRLGALHPWFAELMGAAGAGDRTARFMATSTRVRDVPLQIEEMTGKPGDLYLMHPRALHAGAPNVSDQSRLVLTQFVAPKG